MASLITGEDIRSPHTGSVYGRASPQHETLASPFLELTHAPPSLSVDAETAYPYYTTLPGQLTPSHVGHCPTSHITHDPAASGSTLTIYEPNTSSISVPSKQAYQFPDINSNQPGLFYLATYINGQQICLPPHPIVSCQGSALDCHVTDQHAYSIGDGFTGGWAISSSAVEIMTSAQSHSTFEQTPNSNLTGYYQSPIVYTTDNMITLNGHSTLQSDTSRLPARVQPLSSLQQTPYLAATTGEQDFVQNCVISRVVSSTIPVAAYCVVSIVCWWDNCQLIVTGPRQHLRRRFIAHFQDYHSRVILREKTHKRACLWTSCRCACHRKNRCETQGGIHTEHAAHILDVFSHVWKHHALPQLKET